MFTRTGVNDTVLAIREKLRVEIEPTKVIRYWPGKAPEWADDADGEGDTRTTRAVALKIAFSRHERKIRSLDVVERAGCDWSGMPLDILRIIAGLIDGVEDYIRFGAVCKSWQSATFSSQDDCPKSSKRRLEYPWLVQNEPGDKKGFYSFHTGKKFYLECPEIHGTTCFGTTCGWLVTIDCERKLHLLNPLTRKYLPLPSLPVSAFFAEKALVVWDGDTPIVFLICSEPWHSVLALSRPGDSCWITVDHPCGSKIENIDLFRGQVLAMAANDIHIFDLSLSPPRLKEFSTAPFPLVDGKFVYLVDIGGDLHALSLRHRSQSYAVKNVKNDFLVYKLDMVERRWEEVHTLGGWTAFVGPNSPSFALPSSTDYPLCKPNCIYLIYRFLTFSKCFWKVISVEPWSDDEIRAAGEAGPPIRRGMWGNQRVLPRMPPPIGEFSVCCFVPNLW